MNKVILLTLTFLITAPLIAMEEGAGLAVQTAADQITVQFKDDGQADFDKNILMQSETIKNFLPFDPTGKTVSIADVGFKKDEFMQAYQLMEYAKDNENEKLQLALTSKDISELSSLWQIFDYLDVEKLFLLVNTQLDNTLASYIDENPSSIPDLLAQLPESFKQDKFSITFSSKLLPKDLVNPSFNELATLKHGGIVYSVAFDTHNNLLATGLADKTVKIFNSSDLNNNSKPIATLQYDGSGPSIAFDSTHSLLATGLFDKKMVKVYSSSDLTDNSQPIATLKRNPRIRSVAFDPTNSLLATGLFGKKMVKVYSSSDLTDNSQPIATLQHDGWILSVAFDSTHSLLAIGSMDGTDGTAKIYHSSDLTDNSQPIATLQHDGWVLSVAFDPLHSLLATGSQDRTAKIYHSSDLTDNSQPIATLQHDGPVLSVALDSLHSLLATGSQDRTAKIYNSADLNNNSKPIATLQHGKSVNSVAFDPTKSLLATGSDDGTAKIYKFSLPIFKQLTNEQGLAAIYLLLTKSEPKDVPEVIQQIISTIDKETWSTISEYLKPE